jgi:hypothetical protein
MATDRQGRAEFPVLRPGAGYSIGVTFPGYSRREISDLRVRTAETREVEVRLSPDIRETLEVTASRPLVDLDETARSSRFGDEFLADLPVPGRLYQNALTLAPGVLDADEDGNPNVHGARSRDFKTVVNGVSNVDPLTGQWLSYVNPDSIEELEVIPSGAGVEFGRAQGGFARILQKQGSNEFEGVLNVLFASSKLDAEPSTGTAPGYTTYQPAVQISGPILRERLWYRLSHESVHREEPVDTLRSVEIATETQSIRSYLVTWQATPRNKLALQYQSDPKTLTNVNVSARTPGESAQRQELGGATWSLTWTAAQSPRVLIDSQVAWQETSVNVLPSEPGVPNECVRNDIYPVLNAAQCFRVNDNASSGSYYVSSRDRRQRLTVRSGADVYGGRFWGATHRLKVGFAVENERYYRQLDERPDLTFETFVGIPTYGIATYRIPFPTATSARVAGVNWGVYGEDQLRILPNLSVTLGLRYDREETSSLGWSAFDPAAEAAAFEMGVAQGQNLSALFRTSFTAFQDIAGFQRYVADILRVDPSVAPLGSTTRQSAAWIHRRKMDDVNLRNDNLSPRVAVSWDPWGDGKTKLSVSAGRYYDKIFLAVPLIELEPVTTYLNFHAVRDFLGNFFVDRADKIAAAVSTRVVDRNLTTPYQDEVSAGLEREIGPETALRLTWIRREFRDQLQDEDINHAPNDYGRCITRQPWVERRDGPDGQLDDCWDGPDGFIDLYALNPGWADVLLVGNFNTTRYDAAVLELVRRLYRGWQLESSYTWSKARGDAEDFDQLLGNDRTTADDERGYLAYDQRHVVKIGATGLLRSGWRLGGTVRWESGLPYSILASEESPDAVAPFYLGEAEERPRFGYPTGQRNDARNAAFWTFNARAQREWRLRGATTLGASVDVFNLLDDDSIRVLDQTNGTPNMVRRPGRRFQIGFRLAF